MPPRPKPSLGWVKAGAEISRKNNSISLSQNRFIVINFG